MKHADTIIKFTHKSAERHIQAANVVGRERDACCGSDTSIWRFDGDDAGDLEAQQAEARLLGDNPEIVRECRVIAVDSGTLPGAASRSPTPLNPTPN